MISLPLTLRRVVLAVMLLLLPALCTACRRVSHNSDSPTGLALQDHLVAALNHDGDSRARASCRDDLSSLEHCLDAMGPGWRLVVMWSEDSLIRNVQWWHRDLRGTADILLRERDKPWASSVAGVTTTRYGPYQPSLLVHDEHGEWSVCMAHERMDFPTEGDLLRFLEWGGYTNRAEAALDAEGTMVVLRVSLKGDTVGRRTVARNSLGVELYTLTLRGGRIPCSLLRGKTMGTIARCETGEEGLRPSDP